MSTNVNTALAVGAAAIAVGTTAYALSGSKTFYSASQIGRRADDLSGKSDTNRTSSTKGDHEFDFVIVGGGTAAMVLANRLTERNDVTVLVVEAGKSSQGVQASQIPAAFFHLQRGPCDWDYWTVPQKGCHNRKLAWTRTKTLGGCSSGNAMMFNMGAPQDYDEWAQLQKGADGAEGWAYKEFQKYLQKFETFVPHPEFPCPTEERGKTGPVKTGYFGCYSNLGGAFIPACETMGIPYVPDVNTSKGAMGVTRTPSYIDSNGRRVSTEGAYLTPEVLARPNLKVVCGAQVTKIRFNEAKRAIGVEFAEKETGPVYFVGARKEVILSAGAINTPQILLLSGVGPSSELARHSIPVVQHLPGVGQNLADHIVFNSCFPIRPNYYIGRYLIPKSVREHMAMAGAVAQYLIKGTGPMASTVQECIAFTRVGDGEMGRKVDGGEGEVPEDSTSGTGAPDVEIMAAGMTWRDHGHKKFDAPASMTITTTVLRPTSKGTVTLKSADPWEKPLIDPRYLTTKHDADILVRSVKLAYQLANTEPLKSVIDQTVKHPLLDHALGSKSNAEIEDVIRSRAETGYHPSCTARMAPLEDGGVVDPRLRVYGIQGLRVVDASVQPEIVSGHTSGPTIGIAEKAADLIKEDYPEGAYK